MGSFEFFWFAFLTLYIWVTYGVSREKVDLKEAVRAMEITFGIFCVSREKVDLKEAVRAMEITFGIFWVFRGKEWFYGKL